MQTGGERATATNETGYFQLPFLPLGNYELTAQAAGFATVVAQNIQVTLNNKTTTISLALKISTVQESVTVRDVAPLIDMTGQIRRSVDDVMAGTLPIAGRNFLGVRGTVPTCNRTQPRRPE